MDKMIPFKNWTKKDFKESHGGVFYDFRAGATYSVPQSQAMFFAKKLAVRELHENGYEGSMPSSTNPKVRGEMLADIDVQEYANRCFPSVKPGETSTVASFERIDEVKDVQANAGENTTATIQADESDDEDDNADDEKNNAGQPKFKDASYQ